MILSFFLCLSVCVEVKEKTKGQKDKLPPVTKWVACLKWSPVCLLMEYSWRVERMSLLTLGNFLPSFLLFQWASRTIYHGSFICSGCPQSLSLFLSFSFSLFLLFSIECVCYQCAITLANVNREAEMILAWRRPAIACIIPMPVLVACNCIFSFHNWRVACWAASIT